MKRRIRQHWLKATIRSSHEMYGAAARSSKREGDDKEAAFYRGAQWALANLMERYAPKEEL